MMKRQRDLYPKLALLALLAAYIVLSVISSFAVRLRCGPDEPAHFIYVREIGERFSLPGLAHTETHDLSQRFSHEAHQPPLYYVLASLPYRGASGFGASLESVWMVVRLFTVLIGASWLYFLYRLSREVLGGRKYSALVASACVGLLPMSVYIGSVVNNDVLTCSVFTASMWMIFKALRKGTINGRATLQIGVVSGLAILTKAQGLFLLPIIVILGLMIWRRQSWKQARLSVRNAGAALLIALAIGSFWFVRNQMVYGTPIVQSLVDPLIPADIRDSGDIGSWGLLIWIVTQQLFRYFWLPYWLVSSFQRANPLFSPILVMLYQQLLSIVCLLVAVGVVCHLVECKKRQFQDFGCKVGTWILLLLPSLMIWAFLVRHTFFVDRGTLSQGRLLLPSAAVFGIGLVTGARMIFKGRFRIPAGIALIIALVIANMLMILSITHYYRHV